ncbi:hypothetical protein [Aneurinibacillus soli]|nr:hypothetical protein [Aneurinibacillus soli]
MLFHRRVAGKSPFAGLLPLGNKRTGALLLLSSLLPTMFRFKKEQNNLWGEAIQDVRLIVICPNLVRSEIRRGNGTPVRATQRKGAGEQILPTMLLLKYIEGFLLWAVRLAPGADSLNSRESVPK